RRGGRAHLRRAPLQHADLAGPHEAGPGPAHHRRRRPRAPGTERQRPGRSHRRAAHRSRPELQFSIRARGRLSTPAEFEDLVVKTGQDGTLVRLRDVGRAELGAQDYSSLLRFNGREAVGLGVYQLPSANALAVKKAVTAELDRLISLFPPGVKFRIAFDTTRVVSESLKEVLFTLGVAIFQVVLVIFVFLQTLRSTFIPAVTIPVSLIGTFAFAKALGFSINTLTLFGITLATGLVVDDAIVVIENIERFIQSKRMQARVA